MKKMILSNSFKEESNQLCLVAVCDTVDHFMSHISEKLVEGKENMPDRVPELSQVVLGHDDCLDFIVTRNLEVNAMCTVGMFVVYRDVDGCEYTWALAEFTGQEY